MTPHVVRLPQERVWLRVAHPSWTQPLDATYAQSTGGRWNPPNSFPVLYLNADVATARLQIERLCKGTALTSDDLTDDAYVLVAATLPAAQSGADAVSDVGLRALGLPASYPREAIGALVKHPACQAIGAALESSGVEGVWCRSASTDDGRGREFAWFSGAQSAAAIWPAALAYGAWRYAESWADIELPVQADPA